MEGGTKDMTQNTRDTSYVLYGSFKICISEVGGLDNGHYQTFYNNDIP